MSTSVWNVLHDEYEFLGFENGGTPQDLQPGDVVAWLMQDAMKAFLYARDDASDVTPDLVGLGNAVTTGRHSIPVVEHTCRVLDFRKGIKSPATILVESKNGFHPLVRCTLLEVCAHYKGAIAYYRPGASAPATASMLFGVGSIFDTKA
jgi:hypothetical protein